MGLDQYLQRRELPPILTDRNEKILVELEDKKKKEPEEVFYWRKDYKLNEWVAKNIGKFDNCEELPMTKKHLMKLLEYFKKNNKTEMDNFENETLDYSKEINQLNDILKYDDLSKFEYFYYAWW